MKQQVADFFRHIVFTRIAKINKKIFIPNFISELLSLPIKLVLLCIIWFSIFHTMKVERLNGFRLSDIIIYYFSFAIIMHITSYYRQLPFTVWNEISRGEISKYVCRPISYIKYHFFYGLGYTYYGILFCLPIVILGSFYYFSGIESFVNVIMFLVSIFLGVIITFYIYIIIGMLTFWTESIFGYRDLILHFGAMVSGSIIPLSFFPSPIQRITHVLPFRYMIYDPICILFNSYSLHQNILTIMSQIICLVMLGIITKLVWLAGLKRYEAQGG